MLISSKTSKHHSKLKAILPVIFLSVCVASCTVMRGETTLPQYGNDATITAEVKSKVLQSDMLPGTTVHVETHNGVVQLSGFVHNRAQLAEARRIANSVEGVRDVVNSLVVTPRSIK